jgi:hypothetical protein
LIHLAHGAFETGCPDLQQNVAFGPDCLGLAQCHSSCLVRLVCELCFGACAALDQDALEALLEEQGGILWGNGYAPLVGIGLADDSNCEVGIWESRSQEGCSQQELQCRFRASLGGSSRRVDGAPFAAHSTSAMDGRAVEHGELEKGG